MPNPRRDAGTAAGAAGVCAVFLVAATTLSQPRAEMLERQSQWLPVLGLAAADKRQRQSLGAAARAAGFTQPGYDSKDPKGLWGKVSFARSLARARELFLFQRRSV
jgi:hypothetical protein